MKKHPTLWAVLFGLVTISTVCVHAQGTVNFANAGAASTAPFRDLSGKLLNGTNWFVELLAGPVPSGLLPVQEPFRPSFMNGFFNAGIVPIPTIAPNDFGVAQIRFWDATKASSFAEAQAAGADWNQSGLLPIYTGDPPGPPGRVGPICPLSPSPPALRASRLASNGELVLLRIGCPGSFQVETSTDLLNWLPLVTITNADMVSEFQVPLSTSGSRFYRASW